MLVSVVFVSLTLGLHESTRDSGFRTASQPDWSQMKNGEAKNTFLLDSAGGVDVVGRGGRDMAAFPNADEYIRNRVAVYFPSRHLKSSWAIKPAAWR